MKKCVLLFFSWRIMTLLVALFASIAIPLNEKSWLGIYFTHVRYPYLLWVWANSDGVHYLNIARNGYVYPNFAFFPLLPLLILIVNKLLHIPYLLAGFLIANSAFLCALPVLYTIAKRDVSKKAAFYTLLAVLFFPTSFYYGAVYTDSLFLLFSLLSFLAARKSKWVQAGLWGYLAGLTRLVGIALIPALLIEWYLQQKRVSLKNSVHLFFKQGAYWIFLAGLGIITYGLYLQIYFGDFFLFQKAMGHWNQSGLVFPLQVVYRYIKIFLSVPFSFVYFIAVLEFVATIVYFFIAYYVLRRIRFSYGVFMLIILIIPTITGTFQGMPRYMLHLFPGFIALGIFMSKSKKHIWITSSIMLLLQIFLLAFYTRGYFVA